MEVIMFWFFFSFNLFLLHCWGGRKSKLILSDRYIVDNVQLWLAISPCDVP